MALTTIGAVIALLVVGAWSNVRPRQLDWQLTASLAETGEQRDAALRARADALEARERVGQDRDPLHTQLQREGLASATRLLKQGRYEEARRALGLIPASRRGWEVADLALEIDSDPRPTQVVGTHEWGITATRLGLDGSTLVTCGQDGRVILRDTASGREKELEGGSWSEPIRA